MRIVVSDTSRMIDLRKGGLLDHDVYAIYIVETKIHIKCDFLQFDYTSP